MAAHVYTFLLDLYESDYGEDLTFHLDRAPSASQLHYIDWHLLKSAVGNHQKVQKIVKDILPVYAGKWAGLEKPSTYEEWIAEEYPEDGN